MARKIVCPNCGGDHELVNPGVVMLVCEFCTTSIYLGEEEALAMGQRALLAEDDSRLHLGAVGEVLGRAFKAVGHVRYRHDDGFWDQWFLELSDGKMVWLIEDARRLSLEAEARSKRVPAPDRLVSNQPAIKLSGVTYLTRETGRATCEGGAGQLPFAFEPGQIQLWADLASLDGSRCGTIEQAPGEAPRLYTGVAVPHERLRLSEGDDSASKVRAKEARDVDCPNCGAPLARPGGQQVETLVCGYCGAQADLSTGRAKVMGINPKGLDPQFRFEIGQAAQLRNEHWTVAGRVLLESGSDRNAYRYREYLLHNPTRGALWLQEEGGHFVLVEPSTRAPVMDPLMSARSKLPVAVGKDEEYRFARSGSSRVLWVDGALPTSLAVDDTFVWAELVDPPRLFTVEAKGPDLICFEGAYLPGDELWQAFALNGSPPATSGVHPAQPFFAGGRFRNLLVLGFVFLAINLGLFAWAWTQEGEPELFRLVDPVDFSAGDVVSSAFVLEDQGLLTLRLTTEILDSGDWLEVLVGFVDDGGRVVLQRWVEMALNDSGTIMDVIFGEATEDVTVRLQAPPPGRYRLLIRVAGRPSARALKVDLRSGQVYPIPFLWAALLAAMLPLFCLLYFIWFNGSRWQDWGRGSGGVMDDRISSVFEQSRGVGKQARSEKQNSQGGGS